MSETGPLEQSQQATSALLTLERAALQDTLLEWYLGMLMTLTHNRQG